MPSARSVAVRYAKALFGLAEEAGQIAPIGDDLERLVDLADQSTELADVLLRPLHPADQRRAVLRAVAGQLGLSTTFANFCEFLIEQRRSNQLAAIREEYLRLAEAAAGRVRGAVVSATPLSQGQVDALRGALSIRTGRSVELDVSVDPELLGGVVARVGDLVFDGTLRSRLDGLRADLIGRT